MSHRAILAALILTLLFGTFFLAGIVALYRPVSAGTPGNGQVRAGVPFVEQDPGSPGVAGALLICISNVGGRSVLPPFLSAPIDTPVVLLALTSTPASYPILPSTSGGGP